MLVSCPNWFYSRRGSQKSNKPKPLHFGLQLNDWQSTLGIVCFSWLLKHAIYLKIRIWVIDLIEKNVPRLMRVHLVRNSNSAKFEKSPNIHLVQPIIHLVRILH